MVQGFGPCGSVFRFVVQGLGTCGSGFRPVIAGLGVSFRRLWFWFSVGHPFCFVIYVMHMESGDKEVMTFSALTIWS